MHSKQHTIRKFIKEKDLIELINSFKNIQSSKPNALKKIRKYIKLWESNCIFLAPAVLAQPGTLEVGSVSQLVSH